MPIRSLALESFRQKIFNNKTDVWSFGVFMWELYSLGAVPYVEIPFKQLMNHLEEGHRLLKPQYATHNLYGIMSRCWDFIPDKRPDFRQLLELLVQQRSPESAAVSNEFIKFSVFVLIHSISNTNC